jgi:hypothetical protein
MRNFILALGLFVLPVLSAAEAYHVTFYQKTLVGGKELHPGDYKIRIEGNKALISKGKQVVEAPVRVEATDAKHRGTSVRYLTGDGVYKLDEIRIRNSTTKLVFENGSQAGS